MTGNDIGKSARSRASILVLISVVFALLLCLPEIFSINSVQAQSPKQSQASAHSDAKQAASSAPKKRKGKKQTARKRVPRGQREIESSRVMEIQNALAAAGYYKEQPSGKWDTSTSQAMSTYQDSNGFKVTGKPDALSLKKLGL